MDKKRITIAVTALILPSFVTWLYFVVLAESPSVWQQTAYSIGKAAQFLFPLLVVGWLGIRLPWPVRQSDNRTEADATNGPETVSGHRSWWVGGMIFGLVVGGVMTAIFILGIEPSPLGEHMKREVTAKVSRFGIDQGWQFVLLGIFYSLVHSGLEEYYWRWFVFRLLNGWIRFWPAVIISAAGFMAHHVLLLATFFGWDHPLTYAFSLAVGVGGGVWAVLYARTRSLGAPWLSHLLVDAAIFSIGYWIVRATL